jgi:agmatine/peptidylarginine deiminase
MGSFVVLRQSVFLNEAIPPPNFLETDTAVFVPQYGRPLTDEVAIECVRNHTTKPVVGIDCREIS